MKFNQVIWDALLWAYHDGCDSALQALEAYAAEHDGRLAIVTGDVGQDEYTFIPNPIPKY